MAIRCSSLIVLFQSNKVFSPRPSLTSGKVHCIHFFYIIKELKYEKNTHIKTIRDKGKIDVSLQTMHGGEFLETDLNVYKAHLSLHQEQISIKTRVFTPNLTPIHSFLKSPIRKAIRAPPFISTFSHIFTCKSYLDQNNEHKYYPLTNKVSSTVIVIRLSFRQDKSKPQL